jgi:undecaprenyl-diphosphatase
MEWDVALLEALDAHRTDWATAVARGLMDAGQPTATYVGAVALAVVFAWTFGAWTSVAAAVLASFLATVVAEYGKEVIGRPRPPADLALIPTDGFAMPSSIAALTAGAATPLVLWALHSGRGATARAIVLVLTAGTVLVGASMVYLGAHWVTDVLAGWLLGAVLGFGAYRLLDRGHARQARRWRTTAGDGPA